MAWDVVVRAFFADGGLSAGLAKANAQLNALQRSGPGARAGLKAVEVGARQLAFEAAGLQGGIGQLVRGLAMFGGGSALMLGLTAGIGGAALLYRAFTKDTREAEEAQKKLREELARVAAQAREARVPATERIAGQQAQRMTQFAELNQRIEERRKTLTDFARGMEPEAVDRIIRRDVLLNNLYRERRALGQDIRSENVSAADAAEKQAEEQKRAADEARRLKLELIEANQNQISLIRMTRANIAGFGQFLAARADLDARASLARGLLPAPGLTPLGFEAPGAAVTFANIRRGSRLPQPADTTKPPSHLMDDMRMVQMMVMSLAMVRGGGVGGGIAGLGGVLGGVAGLSGVSKGLAGVLGSVGLGLTALGGVFSLFDNSEERRHRELVRTIEKMGQEVGLDRVTVVFTGPDGHQVRRALTELEEGDAVERIPGPVGAGG